MISSDHPQANSLLGAGAAPSPDPAFLGELRDLAYLGGWPRAAGDDFYAAGLRPAGVKKLLIAAVTAMVQ